MINLRRKYRLPNCSELSYDFFARHCIYFTLALLNFFLRKFFIGFCFDICFCMIFRCTLTYILKCKYVCRCHNFVLKVLTTSTLEYNYFVALFLIPFMWHYLFALLFYRNEYIHMYVTLCTTVFPVSIFIFLLFATS